MSFFKEFGVSDWSARLPSATGAGALIILAFLHLRRFRPGGHLDAALIMVSMRRHRRLLRAAPPPTCSSPRPSASVMLGWYAWYETGKKFWLFDLYFFGAAATLAKGPIAAFLALGIILLFLGLRREWSAIRRTIWLPGIRLFLLMVLPWYIEVQRSNPHFFRIFFLEHNLERFATDRYQHSQHCSTTTSSCSSSACMPWTALALRALWDGMAVSIDEWKVRHKPQRYLGHVRAGDAFPEFLASGLSFPSSSSPSRSRSSPATSFRPAAARHPHRRLPLPHPAHRHPQLAAEPARRPHRLPDLRRSCSARST